MRLAALREKRNPMSNTDPKYAEVTLELADVLGRVNLARNIASGHPPPTEAEHAKMMKRAPIPHPRPPGSKFLESQGPPFYALHTPRGFSTPTVHAFASQEACKTWVLQHKDPTVWIGTTPQVAAAMLARGVALVTHDAGDDIEETP
jgi:hypothetical protein